MDRDEFMELVYETFADEPDNVLANGIIEAADAYVEHEKAQLSQEGATSDLISRQAAIDAIENSSKPYVWQGAEIVRNLPPAQPSPQWIPISDRLPRDGSWNIFTDGKNISVERYKADAIDHFFPNGRWFEFEDVIAWMPLPESYKPNK